MKRSKFLKTSATVIAGGMALTSFKSVEIEAKSKVLPKALLKGDIIGITAPAGSIWNAAHIDKVQKILHDMGFQTRLGKTLYEQEGYLAGSDEMRASELMSFYKDKTISAILTMRGGWGCQRILDLIDFDIIKRNPKIIIGFSDITSLINVIYDQTGIISYHGPCGYSSWGDFTVEQVKNALVYGQPFTMKNPSNYKEDLKTWVSGKAQGELIGGNLTVLSALIGTKYAPNLRNKILFLEEIGEEPYRVDRMLWQLKQANVFREIKGLVLGSFRKCQPEEPEKSYQLAEVFDQHFSSLSIPVFQGAAIGHIAPKFTVPIGVLAEMDADGFTIKTLERSVRI